MFEVWRQGKTLQQKNLSVLKFVSSQLSVEEFTDDEEHNSIKKNVNAFNSKVAQLWKECKRTSKVFENRHHQWLDESIEFFKRDNAMKETNSKRGRPLKDFSEVSDQSKRQKILPLLENYSLEELAFATRKSLEACGKRDAAKIVQEASTSSPKSKRATKIKKAYYSNQSLPIKYTPEEALALYIDGKFTKKSYIMMQQGAKARNANIYPNYNIILEEKNKCYPDKKAITITDISAEVNLQDLVNHTARRIIQVQSDVVTQFLNEASNGVTLLHKWGGDGSASQSNYKQKFSGEGTSEPKSDSNLFATCLVPLRLSTNNGRILWQNPRPSSTRYCRPIKLIFKKETSKLVKEEIQNIENQISEIQPTNCGLGSEQVVIKHSFNLTMIDGKTFGVVSNSSNQSCGICGATPKIMNQLEKIWSLQPNSQLYMYGISNLHAWIRCLECCLHISYRLDIKKWQIRDEDEKKQVKERKQRLIETLKSEMSLLVDIPKPGFGTTNDGNTARKFFREYALSSSITGLNEDFLKRLYVILTALSCGFMINNEAFAEYAKTTAKLYVELYLWYNMPSSLHRILIHGPEIVKAATLPIGMFSEEALESRNKDFRKYRQCNTRKFSRTKTMQDLFNALLVSSDPVISSLSQCIGTRSHKPTLNKEVLELLQEPEKSLNNFSENEDERSD
jgi:hypothetical protein